MAAALPVIVSDRCGCAPDLVAPGKNGFVFDPIAQDAQHTLTALLSQLSALSADQRSRMGQRSAEIVHGFSPARFGHSVASIVAASSGAPGGRA